MIDKADTNTPIRMYIALKILRAWNNGTAGFHGFVVKIIHDWIDSGMKGPIPWPNDPFFAEWAQENGLSQVGESIGYRFQMELTT